jgi:phage/plasmid-like protein (TIGR03299 family)
MHDLDITNGTATFLSAREDAWHHLGKTLDHSFTAEEAMTEGLLGGWNVRKLPMTFTTESGLVVPVPGRAAVVRDNPVVPGQVDYLGDTGENFHIIQNEEHAAYLNALVEEGGAHFDTAGALDGGRKVFITMKLPGHILIGGVDQIDMNLATLNAHDGSMSYTTMCTPTRIVCKNTMNMAYGTATGIFRVRHTSGATKAIQKAREVLELSFAYLDEFQKEADMLINTTLTQARFEEIIAKEFGAPEDSPAATVTRTEGKIEQMAELFADAATQEGIRNTAWAGLNALTEWYDHFSPTRGDDRDASRAQKALLEPAFKNQAKALMLALV